MEAVDQSVCFSDSRPAGVSDGRIANFRLIYSQRIIKLPLRSTTAGGRSYTKAGDFGGSRG